MRNVKAEWWFPHKDDDGEYDFYSTEPGVDPDQFKELADAYHKALKEISEWKELVNLQAAELRELRDETR